MEDVSLYLFDGSNLFHAGRFAHRDELVDELASFVAVRGARGVVVFDGVGVARVLGALEVQFAADADTVLEGVAVHVGEIYPGPRMAAVGTAAELASLIRDRGPAVVLSGAGMSTESGIPDFRSASGIWIACAPAMRCAARSPRCATSGASCSTVAVRRRSPPTWCRSSTIRSRSPASRVESS